MKIFVPLNEQEHTAMLDGGMARVWWGGVGNSTPQDPTTWREFIATV